MLRMPWLVLLLSLLLRQVTDKRKRNEKNEKGNGMGHNWLGPAFSGGSSDSTQYHGSEANLRPGDKITPGRSNIRGRAGDSGGYVHSTPSQASAWAFARFKGGRKVYQVEHTGPTESDPNDTGDPGDAGTGARRSRRPMRVVREVGGADRRP